MYSMYVCMNVCMYSTYVCIYVFHLECLLVCHCYAVKVDTVLQYSTYRVYLRNYVYVCIYVPTCVCMCRLQTVWSRCVFELSPQPP